MDTVNKTESPLPNNPFHTGSASVFSPVAVGNGHYCTTLYTMLPDSRKNQTGAIRILYYSFKCLKGWNRDPTSMEEEAGTAGKGTGWHLTLCIQKVAH